MVVSEEKTKYQVFFLARNPLDIQIEYNYKILEKTETSKYLGVTFDTKLSWNEHVNKIIEKATKRFRV